jgi:hypothetical protein
LYGYGILKKHDLINIISPRLSYEPLKNGKNTYCNFKKYLISKSQNSMFKFDKIEYRPDKTFYYPSASFLIQMNESDVADQVVISKIVKKFDGYVERSKAFENGYVNFKKLNHGYLYPYPETAVLSMMNVDLIKPCVWLPYIGLH